MKTLLRKSSIKLTISIVLILVIIASFIGAAIPVMAANFESYTSGRDGASSFDGISWRAQTFTTDSAHTVSAVNLQFYKDSTYSGTITVSIRDTSGGLPTGGDLCSGTYGSSSITDTSGPGTMYLIAMDSAYALANNHVYAIVVRASNDDTGTFHWDYDTNQGYANGQGYTSRSSSLKLWI
jgi:hypothetical protein